MTMPALHYTSAGGIRIGLASAVMVCVLLSSCLTQQAPDLGDPALAFEIGRAHV